MLRVSWLLFVAACARASAEAVPAPLPVTTARPAAAAAPVDAGTPVPDAAASAAAPREAHPTLELAWNTESGIWFVKTKELPALSTDGATVVYVAGDDTGRGCDATHLFFLDVASGKPTRTLPLVSDCSRDEDPKGAKNRARLATAQTELAAMSLRAFDTGDHPEHDAWANHSPPKLSGIALSYEIAKDGTTLLAVRATTKGGEKLRIDLRAYRDLKEGGRVVGTLMGFRSVRLDLATRTLAFDAQHMNVNAWPAARERVHVLRF